MKPIPCKAIFPDLKPESETLGMFFGSNPSGAIALNEEQKALAASNLWSESSGMRSQHRLVSGAKVKFVLRCAMRFRLIARAAGDYK